MPPMNTVSAGTSMARAGSTTIVGAGWRLQPHTAAEIRIATIRRPVHSRCMRIDAHQHFWELNRFAYPWMPAGPGPLRHDYLPERLRMILARNKFDGSVAVQATTEAGEAQWLLG